MACVQNIANPISLARKVMTDTPHCMLAGEGALKFARSVGIPVLEDRSSLISDRSYQIYMKGKLKHENLKKESNCDRKDTAVEKLSQENRNTQPEGHDTVGAVAMDTNGHIAVSNSTGNELNIPCDTAICHKLPVLQSYVLSFYSVFAMANPDLRAKQGPRFYFSCPAGFSSFSHFFFFPPT